MKNPSKIPGLKIWLDAADISTVNNGTVQNSQNVFKIVDKSSGYVFRNGYGVNGPSYSVGVVNGKNAITFNYYTIADINSVQSKGLWAAGVTPMASGTYSLYCVAFPYDNRQRNANGAGVASSQQIHFLGLVNELPTSIPTGYSLPRNLVFTTPGTGATNSSPIYREDINNTSPTFGTQFDKVNTSNPNNNSLPPSDPKYVYGKANIIGVRARSGAKKFTIIRNNYISNENFQRRTSFSGTFSVAEALGSVGESAGFTPIPGGPWLTIGAIIPNSSSTSVEGVAGPISATLSLNGTTPIVTNSVYAFEGHFCELLFFDRVLSNSEANSIESYLKDKWIG